jgi:hypothetical protein
MPWVARRGPRQLRRRVHRADARGVARVPSGSAPRVGQRPARPRCGAALSRRSSRRLRLRRAADEGVGATHPGGGTVTIMGRGPLPEEVLHRIDQLLPDPGLRFDQILSLRPAAISIAFHPESGNPIASVCAAICRTHKFCPCCYTRCMRRNKAVRGKSSCGTAAIRAQISLRDGIAQTSRSYVENLAGASAAASK